MIPSRKLQLEFNDTWIGFHALISVGCHKIRGFKSALVINAYGTGRHELADSVANLPNGFAGKWRPNLTQEPIQEINEKPAG
ncbi:MAG: hypothetical protein QXF23_06615 [Candidatus Bathyarchaeia archaeon]